MAWRMRNRRAVVSVLVSSNVIEMEMLGQHWQYLASTEIQVSDGIDGILFQRFTIHFHFNGDNSRLRGRWLPEFIGRLEIGKFESVPRMRELRSLSEDFKRWKVKSLMFLANYQKPFQISPDNPSLGRVFQMRTLMCSSKALPTQHSFVRNKKGQVRAYRLHILDQIQRFIP